MNAPSRTRVRFEAVIEERFGLDLAATRSPETDRVLSRRAAAGLFSDPEAYVVWLERLPEQHPEWAALVAGLTVGETYFFRDPGVFTALARHVLPALIAERRAVGSLRLRVWSAGCATGEEPYSIAIILDRLLPDRRDWSVTILGSDINAEALARAAHGVYRDWALRATDPGIRRRYFEQRDDVVELDPEIRRMVSFAPLNLRRDALPDPLPNTDAMDVILCRNVLIYFTPEAQRATAAALGRALAPEGWIVPSPAEASADIWAPLSPVNFPEAILFRRGSARPSSMQRPAGPSVVPIPLAHGGVAPVSARLPAEQAPVLAPTHDPPQLLDEARRAADDGRLAEARELCHSAVARDPLDPEARLLLGIVCREQEDFRGARDAIRGALYLAPDLAAAHLLLGTVHDRAGDLASARHSMNVVLRMLDGVEPEVVRPGAHGLTAGQLVAAARTYLMLDQERRANGT